MQKLHAIGIYDVEALQEALGGSEQKRPPTLNRRLRKAGFKVFGKEAIALLSLEIKKAFNAEGAEKAPISAPARAGIAKSAQPAGQRASVQRPAGASERVASAIKAGADGNTEVEVLAHVTTRR